MAGAPPAAPTTPPAAAMVVAVLPDAGMRARLTDSARRLGAAVRFVATCEEARAALGEALGPTTLARLEEPLGLEALGTPATDREGLYQFCRGLVAAELHGDAREELLQTLATLVYSVPAGAAAVVSVATGGLGQDAVIWAGTLLSTPLLERFVDLLGADVRERVTSRWADSHGATLAQALEARFFAPLLGQLDTRVREGGHTARILTETTSRIAS